MEVEEALGGRGITLFIASFPHPLLRLHQACVLLNVSIKKNKKPIVLDTSTQGQADNIDVQSSEV